MHKRIHDFAEQVYQHAGGIDKRLVCAAGDGVRVVADVCAEETGRGPVEEAVLEDIRGGHGIRRELVHEERFELALDEVQDHHGEGQPLGSRHGRVAIFVQVGTQSDDQDVEEDGAEVFNEEDGPPGNLGACGTRVS